MEEQVPRPQPVVGHLERIREWVGWFGLSRLIAAAVATVIVCVGAVWLVRTPPPSSEAALPSVAAAAAPQSTLPPPVGRSTQPAASAPPDHGGLITVHVAGAVERPGVYRIDAPARVHIAIEVAGGVSAVADPDSLNLAAEVIDGSRIYVPEVGEVVASVVAPVSDGGGKVAGPVDVNRATAAELDTLPGIGPATASAIVTERERDGPFLTVDDLERVPGIGPAKLASIRDLVIA